MLSASNAFCGDCRAMFNSTRSDCECHAFMQDRATSHTANPVKAFLIQTFGKTVASRRCRYPWPPRSPDLAPADGYLKSRVYLSGPSSLSELKDAIRREVSSIHPDVLHSTVARFVTRLECLLPCGGGHVV
ncbi:uncharacterized protein TNCV_146151 [Trichonephila clavipes]|nr:uncharacterized protein TNCV_146151 [Trichonephila clavipes]